MGANSPYVDGGAIEIVAQYLASGPPNLTADGYRNLQVDAAGNLKVNVVIGGGGGGGGTASSVTLNDPTTTTNQAAVLAPGGSGAFALAVQGVPGGTPQPFSAAALPLPTGAATSALQPSLGTAGTPSSNVITVQGIANGKVLPTATSNGIGADTAFPGSVSTSGTSLGSLPAGATGLVIHIPIGASVTLYVASAQAASAAAAALVASTYANASTNTNNLDVQIPLNGQQVWVTNFTSGSSTTYISGIPTFRFW